MEHNLSAYPRRWEWSQSGTGPNIDHRRVPNLMVFFSRKKDSLPVTAIAADYGPGDMVTWDLGNNVPSRPALSACLTARLTFPGTWPSALRKPLA
jgi:uncharacterized protein YijF (DUF1287 family)